MVRGWLPAGAAHTAHAHSEAHQTSALPDSQREHRRRCPPLLQEITNAKLSNVNLKHLDMRHLRQGSIVSMYKRNLQVRHGVTENSWSTTHFLDELQNVNATVAQNANTNEAALMM